MQTLADLKALVEAEDNPTSAKAEPVAEEEAELEPEELEQEDGAAEDESDEDESESEESESEDEPEWAKKPDAKNFVPARVHSELRKNLRATQSGADAVKAENEQLKARLAALDVGSAPQAQQLKVPTLAECDFDDDLHAQRLAEYSEKLLEQKLAERDRTKAVNSQQEQINAQINSQVDKHYERAGELISKGTVTEENFKSADLLVRKAVAESIKGDADYITDYIIASLGEGSEKVIYHLGVNPKALGELKSAFAADPSGLRAATYLGELKGKFNSSPMAKLSNAPKPDKALKGSAKVTTDSAKRAYLKAEKADSVGGMLAAKRAAKAAGIDTSKW
jgi:hypothetical protein